MTYYPRTAAIRYLAPGEIPTWLRDTETPGALLFGAVADLEAYMWEHGYPRPSLLELESAREIRRRRSSNARRGRSRVSVSPSRTEAA